MASLSSARLVIPLETRVKTKTVHACVAQTPVRTAKEQCKEGGYEAFGFRNQGECVAFVERSPKNEEEVPS